MNRKTKVAVGVFFLAWLGLLAFFWILDRVDDALAFALLSVVVEPTAIAVMSFSVGKNESTKYKVIAIVLSGLMLMLLPSLTFDLLNTLTFHHLNAPSIVLLGWGMLISLVFVLIGTLVTYIRNRKNINDEANAEQTTKQ